MSGIFSLCTGIGGLDRAVSAVTGEQVVCAVEFEPHLRKFLQREYPSALVLDDVKTVVWSEVFPPGDKIGRGGNPEAARAMYAMYLDGASLAEVGQRFGRSRQSVYTAFKRRRFPLRGPNFRPTVEWNGKTYSLADTGYLRRTDGNRAQMHREVWEFHHGTIPDDHDIHHVDRDRTNNDISNLMCLSKADHSRLHSAEDRGDAKEASRLILTAGFP